MSEEIASADAEINLYDIIEVVFNASLQEIELKSQRRISRSKDEFRECKMMNVKECLKKGGRKIRESIEKLYLLSSF